MKKLLLNLAMTMISITSFGQVTCGNIASPEEWNFDDGFTPSGYSLQIDTVTYPNNIWQIGAPQKNVINSAFSPPNVIITDKSDQYPPNDTSVFLFKHIDQGGYSTPHSAELAGYYMVNSDSLNDYGTIEISLDQGTTWINLITDTFYTSFYQWFTPKPTLTGNSKGWVNFWVHLADLGQAFNVNLHDTIIFKFTFISDSISDTLDGLAYDNFQFCDGVEGIKEILSDNLIVVYPNPTHDLLFIERRIQPQNESVKIYNLTGQIVFEDKNFKEKFVDIKKIKLKDGFYFLYYSDAKSYSIKKIILHN